ncbi:MAG: AAA family ATPase, partial [Candidatus Pacebacteria bacterium]|nr:AAA family ATPase [Candidatus Paceibacterota bacterium]
PDKARLFENMQNEYESKLNNLTTLKNGYIQILQDLNKELNRKKESPFDSLEQRELLDNTTKLENAIKEIKTNIDTHNLKVDSFEIEKQKAKVKLINHFTAEFIINKDYFKIQSEIKKNNNNIQTLRPEIDTLVEEIKNINSQIKKEAIGADKINEYLKQFFNDGKLKVQLTENSKYKLYRNNQIAKNLSTGEKNIISLIYFFAKLEETDFNFNNAVIFLDDPVSSLDNNHIFKVYAFINEKLKDCKQFFITTHNFDFFNLLKDLSRYDLKNKGNFYLVKKIKNQTGEFSCIENLPNILLCFKSEYNYLFSILKSFNEIDDKSNFELLYLLPNVVRRFFEAYLFMKYPDGKKFDSKAKTFLKDTNISNKQNILKLIDEYSHEENPEHSQKFPDIEEVENAVSFILETIEEKDKEHYKALCESLKNN